MTDTNAPVPPNNHDAKNPSSAPARMNDQLWNEHLTQRIRDLERDNWRLRVRLSRHKKRAELWRHRALTKTARNP